MPDTPPGGDDQQAAVGRKVRKKGCSQQKYEAQSGVLDARLDGKGAPVGFRNLEGCADAVSDHQGHEIVDEDHEEDVPDAFEEGVHVAREGQDDHRDEKEDGNPLERLLEPGRYLGKEACRQDAGDKRYAQQDENRLEHVPERDGQGGNVGMDGREMQVGIAPEPEIERSHHHGKGGCDGCETHGQFDIGLCQGRHEIGDVPAGAGGDEDHAEAHHRGNPPAHEDSQQTGESRQQKQLADEPEDDRFGLFENFYKDSRFDAQRHAVHDEREHDVDGVHAAGIQGNLDLVDGMGGFR